MPQRGYVSQPRVGRGTRPTLGSMCERFPTPTGLCPAGEVSTGGHNPVGVEDVRGAGSRGSTEDGATPGCATQPRWGKCAPATQHFDAHLTPTLNRIPLTDPLKRSPLTMWYRNVVEARISSCTSDGAPICLGAGRAMEEG